MAEEQDFFTDGAAYERLMGRWSALAGENFIDWLAQPKGLRWLDVGCGTGAFTELLVARCAPAEVQGLDPSAAQIAYASTRPTVGLAHFRQGDAQALPFADDSFDAAVMALVINFVPDPARAVAEMARVVRPGGWVATYMWNAASGGTPIEPLSAALRSIGIAINPPPSVAASDKDRLRALWQQAGLDAVDTTVIRIPVTYSGIDDFWESTVVPVGPQAQAIREMSASTRAQLRERLSRDLPTDRDGRISFSAGANAVKGRLPG